MLVVSRRDGDRICPSRPVPHHPKRYDLSEPNAEVTGCSIHHVHLSQIPKDALDSLGKGPTPVYGPRFSPVLAAWPLHPESRVWAELLKVTLMVPVPVQV